jgi:hypothetical protein
MLGLKPCASCSIPMFVGEPDRCATCDARRRDRGPWRTASQTAARTRAVTASAAPRSVPSANGRKRRRARAGIPTATA